MQSKIDYEIVISAEEDYTEIHSLILFISNNLNVNVSDALDYFFERCEGLRKQNIPLLLFKSSEAYGDMTMIEWQKLKEGDIFDSNNNMSGPPYYFLSINGGREPGFYAGMLLKQ